MKLKNKHHPFSYPAKLPEIDPKNPRSINKIETKYSKNSYTQNNFAFISKNRALNSSQMKARKHFENLAKIKKTTVKSYFHCLVFYFNFFFFVNKQDLEENFLETNSAKALSKNKILWVPTPKYIFIINFHNLYF